MHKIKCISLVTFILLIPIVTIGETLNITPGYWEVCGSQMDSPMSCTYQCYKKDDLVGDKICLPGQNKFKDKDDCQIISYNNSGSSISWKVVCNDGSSKEINGNANYNTNKFDVTVNYKVDFSGNNNDLKTMHSTVKGKLINNTCE